MSAVFCRAHGIHVNVTLPEADEKKLSSLKGEKLLVLGSHLGLIIRSYVKPKNMIIISSEDSPSCYTGGAGYIHNDVDKKANLAMNIMMNALEKKFDVKHEYKI